MTTLREKLVKIGANVVRHGRYITFQQVQKYEKGVNRMSASRLWLAAEVLKVPISFFFDDYDGDKKAELSPWPWSITRVWPE